MIADGSLKCAVGDKLKIFSDSIQRLDIYLP